MTTPKNKTLEYVHHETIWHFTRVYLGYRLLFSGSTLWSWEADFRGPNCYDFDLFNRKEAEQ